jgi:hypothetical protein
MKTAIVGKRYWTKKKLQSGVGPFVRLGCPFRKHSERVAGLARLVEQDAIAGDAVAQGIAGLQLQLFAYRARNHGPALDRELRERGGLAEDAVHIGSLLAVLQFSSLGTGLH